MNDEAKTKKQLIEELCELRRLIGDLLNYPKESMDLTDLTQLKEASGKMRKNQEKFMKSFLQNGIPMALTTSKEGVFSEINESFLKLTGLKRNEIIGNTSTALGLLSNKQLSIILDKLNKKGWIENLELQLKLKNGKMVHGLFNTVMMTLGREKYLLTVMTDITKLKQEKARPDGLHHLPINDPMPWFIN